MYDFWHTSDMLLYHHILAYTKHKNLHYEFCHSSIKYFYLIAILQYFLLLMYCSTIEHSFSLWICNPEQYTYSLERSGNDFISIVVSCPMFVLHVSVHNVFSLFSIDFAHISFNVVINRKVHDHAEKKDVLRPSLYRHA